MKKLAIAAIGDSVTAGFHVSSELGMLLYMWQREKISWFYHTVERIAKYIPVVSHNYSTAGGRLRARSFNPVIDSIFNIQNMHDQVNSLLRQRVFPDLIFVWMGHNELHWVRRKENFQEITKRYRREF